MSEPKKYLIHHTAQLAWKLLEHFAIVTGKPDGEDSAGRAKLNMMEPAELVERAFTITEIFIAEAVLRGHMTHDD